MNLRLSLALVALVAQGEINFQDPEKSITLRNFADFEVDAQENRLVFSGTGAPLAVELRDQGITIRGQKIDGVAVPEANRRYSLREANVQGNAEIESSTAIADATAAERAKAANAPIPAPRLESTVTTLASETIRYTADANEGRADIPGPFTVVSQGSGRGEDTRQGKRVAFTYVQRFDARGTRGTLTLDPRPTKEKRMPLRTGTIEGPIEFTFERTETIEGVPVPSVSRAKGRADRMELGMEGDNYLVTATGNVEIDSEGEGTLGQMRAQTLVVTLDKNMRPIRYRASGTPASVKATPGGKG